MMFSETWLALREPWDRLATAPRPLAALIQALAGRAGLRAVDLGAGTGAAIRLLAPLLPRPQQWLAVERQPQLVAAGARQLAAQLPEGVTVHWLQADLATSEGLQQALAGDCDLITASALLDLVSRPWLARLVALIAERRAVFWSRLTVDGRIRFAPGDAFDARLVALLGAHQRTDKGFGPALGPRAPAVLRQLLRTIPGRWIEGRSDWRLGPEAKALQAALICDWAQAATAMAKAEAEAIAAWRKRRLARLAGGRARLWVGHRDLTFLP